MEKITKRQIFTGAIALLNGSNTNLSVDDIVKGLAHELELLDKKNASRKTELTDTQKENLQYKDDVVAYLTEQTDSKSNSQIAKYLGITTQKLTNILKTLVNENKISVETIKRTNYYKVAE